MLTDDATIRILIVDDDVVVRELLERILAGQGYELLLAHDGAAAVALAQQQPITCCFIDERMPGMSGAETIRAIRAIHPDAICFLMTGGELHGAGAAAFREGATDLLSKPIKMARVRRLVERHVGHLSPLTSQLFQQSKALRDTDTEQVLTRTETALLLVDDDTELCALARRVLLNEGYHVDVVHDGEEALACMRVQNYHVVITDLKMPKSDGLTLMRAAKTISPNTEFLIITAYASIETMREAMRLEACDYLTKPLEDIFILVQVVARIVERQALREQNQSLLQEFHRKAFELGVLHEVGQAISYTMDYQQLVEVIMNSLHKVVAYDIAGALMLGPAQSKLQLIVLEHEPEYVLQDLQQRIVAATDALSGGDVQASEIGVTFRVLNPEMSRIASPGQQYAFRSLLNVPLMIDRTVVGMLCVATYRPHGFSTRDVRLLYTVARQMSEAVGRLQHLIAQEKTKMDSLVESMGDGIVMTDVGGQVVVVNPAAREMLRLPAHDTLTVERLTAGFHALGVAQISLSLDQVGDGQDTQAPTYTAVITEPHERILDVHQRLVKDDQGQLLGYMTLMRDVTEQKKLSHMKDDFISTVSHELRTPLTIVKASIENLHEGIVGPLTSEQQHVVDVSRIGTDRLARLINDLLDLSRLESGKTEPRCDCVDPAVLMESIREGFAASAEKQGVELTCAVDPTTPCLYADPDLVMQILNNLLSNAVRCAKTKVTMTAHARAQQIVLSVIDDGVGIAPSDQHKLFSKFEQIHRPIGGAGYKGTGLGLAICQKIVEQHDGTIWVESEIDQGARFHVALPQYRNPRAKLSN